MEQDYSIALHQVHHSSEDYNLTTALRQSAFQGFGSWVEDIIILFVIVIVIIILIVIVTVFTSSSLPSLSLSSLLSV